MNNEEAHEVPRDLGVWDARTGQLVLSLNSKRESPSIALLAGAVRHAMPIAWPTTLQPWHFALHPTGRLLATADVFGVRLWDLRTGEVIRTLPLHIHPPSEFARGSPASAIAFSPDGTRLATGLVDGTILLWSVPRPLAQSPKPEEIPALLADLAGADAAKGWKAVWVLADVPNGVVRRIRDRVQPAETLTAATIDQLIADLDAPAFRRREAATRRLEGMADRVQLAVNRALAAPASEEAGDRLRRILTAVPDDSKPLPPWAASLGRVVALLEQSADPDALAFLKDLAAGAPGAWLTRDSQEALKRVAEKRPSAK